MIQLLLWGFCVILNKIQEKINKKKVKYKNEIVDVAQAQAIRIKKSTEKNSTQYKEVTMCVVSYKFLCSILFFCKVVEVQNNKKYMKNKKTKQKLCSCFTYFEDGWLFCWLAGWLVDRQAQNISCSLLRQTV